MSFILLGILNAQVSGVAAEPAYDLLETTILGSDTASVTFSSLNSTYGSTYKHLQIRMSSAQTVGSNGAAINLRFNSDSGANYSYHGLFGSGSTVGSYADTSQTTAFAGLSAGNGQPSGVFAASVCDLLDVFSTSKYKTTRALEGVAPGEIGLMSGNWRNTSAVTSITLLADSGGDFKQDSRFSLYGIKAA